MENRGPREALRGAGARGGPAQGGVEYLDHVVECAQFKFIIIRLRPLEIRDPLHEQRIRPLRIRPFKIRNLLQLGV